MRSDVHSAALRAAAKVAFSVAFIGGCSAPASDLADDDLTNGTSGDGVEPGTSESEISSKKKPAKKTTQLSTAPCDKHKDAGPPLSCEQVVNAAFPVEGNYPGEKQSVSVQVQTCCAELLAADESWMAPHRWDCCANLPADAGQNISIACTPWGPPVPPSMKSRRVAAMLEVA
jgi:hypothetical protein